MDIPPEILSTAISTGAWAWNKLTDLDPAKSIAEGAGQKIGEAGLNKLLTEIRGWGWGAKDWNNAVQNYQRKILERYGTSRVLGKSAPLSLDDIYVNLNILEKPSHYYSRREIKSNSVSGIEFVARNGNSLVFGKPGAGKTTFLKHVAINAARNSIFPSTKADSSLLLLDLSTPTLLDKVPIYVVLKDFDNYAKFQLVNEEITKVPTTLLDFIVEEFKICGFPTPETFVELLLYGKKALLLFDGLDEVTQESRSKVCTTVRNFTDKYSTSQCLISCRNRAEIPTLILERFTHVEIADFTPSQINRYATKYFARDEKSLKIFCAGLEQSEAENRISSLARVPMLLSQICLAIEKSGVFPRSRADIYRKSVDALVEDWDVERGITRDPFLDGMKRKERKNFVVKVLSEIAQSNFLASKAYNFALNSFEAWRLANEVRRIVADVRKCSVEEVDGESFLRAVQEQTGLINMLSDNYYAFLHLSIQEYFTANYFVARGEVKNLITTESVINDQWSEVLITASRLSEAQNGTDDFLKHFHRACWELIKESRPIVRMVVDAYEQSKKNHLLPEVEARAYYMGILLAHACTTALPTETATVLIQFLRIHREITASLGSRSGSSLDPPLTFTVAEATAALRTIEHRYGDNNNGAIVSDSILMLLSSFAIRLNSSVRIGGDSVEFKYFYYLACEKLKVLKENDLGPSLSNLSPPMSDANSNHWRKFGFDLQRLIESKRPYVCERTFSDKDLNALRSYLIASGLMLKCIAISELDIDRQSLFLPQISLRDSHF